jgi:hypothetical protein
MQQPLLATKAVGYPVPARSYSTRTERLTTQSGVGLDTGLTTFRTNVAGSTFASTRRNTWLKKSNRPTTTNTA